MSEKIIRVHMIRVLPESLPAVCQQIRSAVSKNPEVKTALYLCFGDYDLVVISCAPYGKGRILGDEWHSGVVGIREIPVFHWCHNQDSEDVFDTIVKNRNLCLLFAYLNPLAPIDYGLRLERQVAANFAEDIAVLGLYGIPELLFVAPWFDPTNIQQACTGIYRIFADVTRANGLPYPLLLRTLSFVLLGGDALDVLESLDDSCESVAIPRVKDLDPCLSLRISVGSSFRYHKEMEAASSRIFRDLRMNFFSSPGQQDFTFDVSLTGTSVNLIDTLRLILSFRGQASARLLNTTTSLIFSQRRHGPTGDDQIDEAFLSFPGLRRTVALLDSQTCQRIELTLGETGRRVIRTVFNFNDLISNPAVTSSVLDMFRAVAMLADRADHHSRELVKLSESEGFDPEGQISARDREEELNQLMMPIHAAVDQRTIAAHAAVSPVESNTRHLIGGIGRLLLAIESIPHSLFRAVPGERYNLWWGYALSGVRHTHFYHDMQVIDVPPEGLWKPEDWFVVIHESLHAIVSYELVREGSFSVLGAFLKPLAGWKRELALESAIDLLTCNCGPEWNLGLYFKAIWSYLGRCLRTGNSKHWDRNRFGLLVLRNWNVWLVNHLMAKGLSVLDLSRSPAFRASIKTYWDQMLFEYEQWGLAEISNRIREEDFLSLLFEESEFYPGCLVVLESVWKSRLFDTKKIADRKHVYENHIPLALGTSVFLKESADPELAVPPELVAWKVQEMALSKLPLVINNKSVDLAELREGTIRILIGAYWESYRKARVKYQRDIEGWNSNAL